MSYNIDVWKTKRLEHLIIPVAAASMRLAWAILWAGAEETQP